MAASSDKSSVIYYSSSRTKHKQNTPVCFIKMTRAFKNALMIEDIPYYRTMRSLLLHLKLM